MTFPKNEIDFEALLYALTQQTEPLPKPLQRSLQEAGEALRQNQPGAERQIRELIKQHRPLEEAYKAALEQWYEQYTSQLRTKSLTATFENTSGLYEFFVYDVLPTEDWVATAKQRSHQHKIQVTTDSFWDKTDRIAVMIAGGAALGSAIAQLPGAIAGAIFAAGYGWYISFAKTKSLPNS